MTELQGHLYIPRQIELRCGGTAPPFTWGMFRHCILLPSDADAWSSSQKRAVLAHELAHAKRFDGLIHFLVQVVCSVYWFNPIVWLAARRMRLERERACDDYALNAGAIPGAYAEHLLALASGGNSHGLLATTSIAQPSQLETRLRAILNPKTRRGRLSRWTAAVLMSSLLTIIVSVAAVHLTTLLSLSLPTSFGAMAAPRRRRRFQNRNRNNSQPSRRQPRAQSQAGSFGPTEPHPPGLLFLQLRLHERACRHTWIMGTSVAGTAITDSNGQYRIENLAAGSLSHRDGPRVFAANVLRRVSIRQHTPRHGDCWQDLRRHELHVRSQFRSSYLRLEQDADGYWKTDPAIVWRTEWSCCPCE